MYLYINWDLFASSSTHCHPGRKYQHCKSVTDRISNQRWSCQRQVRSSIYCYLFVFKKNACLGIMFNQFIEISYNLGDRLLCIILVSMGKRMQQPCLNCSGKPCLTIHWIFQTRRGILVNSVTLFAFKTSLNSVNYLNLGDQTKLSIRWSCWRFLIFYFVCLSSAAPSLYEW